MNSRDRWTRVERWVDRLLDTPAAGRGPVVDAMHAEDASVAPEVMRLLAAIESAHGLLAEPASSYAAPLLAWSAGHEPLATGARLGPYEIVSRLGQGASATVYLAHDPKHRRSVALKVLHPELAAAIGPDRFLREIDIAAALHHPHILPLFDSGIIDGLLYYVMPHVDGESLRARLRPGAPLPAAEAARIASEVAGALDYAHRHGVVHRDVKPENILLQDGQAIVADFGIARAMDGSGARRPSDPGFATGTPAYMSPEQAAGAEVDGRTDIYALGCVLYEMLAGRPPFSGTAPEMLAGHASEQPVTLRGAGPLEAAAYRALAKDPADRFATADAFGAALTGERSGRRAAGWVAAAVLFLLLAVPLARILRSPPGPQLGRRTPLTVEPGLEIDPAISPDADSLAYAAGPLTASRVYVRSVGDRTAAPRAPGSPVPQRYPAWSPDGRRILFRSPRGIEIVSGSGGAPTLAIADTALMPGAWAPDGRSFVGTRGDSLFVVALDRGPMRLLAVGGEPHSSQWSPDGRWIAYVDGNRASLEPGFAFGNVAQSSIRVVRSSGGASVAVTMDRSSNMSPTWLPGSRALLFVSDRDGGRDIYRVTLTGQGGPSAAPARLTTGLNAASIRLSTNGRRLVYAAFSETSNVWTVPIPVHPPVSVSSARPVTSGSQVVEGFAVSPDGRDLAFDSDRSGIPGIYRLTAPGGEPRRLTADSIRDFGPSWSPDGREIAFHSFVGNRRHIFVMSADGTGRRQVTDGGDDERSPVWAGEGRRIVFVRNIGRADMGLSIVARNPLGGWGRSRKLDMGAVRGATFSPDGASLALSSDAGLFVGTLDGGPGRLLVPTDVSLRPGAAAWSPDGREVYYLALDRADEASIWAVARAGGTPRLLVRFDDPTRRWHRFGFGVGSGRLYFTLGDRQSDVWMMDVLSTP